MKHYTAAIIFLIAATSYVVGCDSQNGDDNPLVGTYSLLDTPIGVGRSTAGNEVVYVDGSLNLKSDGAYEQVLLSREYERFDFVDGEFIYSGEVGGVRRIVVEGRWSAVENTVTFVRSNLVVTSDSGETESRPLAGEERGEFVSGIMLVYEDNDGDVDFRFQKD